MQEIVHLLNEMSPFLLLGFLLAGLMHAFIPARYYKRFLSRRSMKSVINAALLGIPLPLCSCGVIPTAMSLRKEGASKGATTSFLIATPQTGVDSIIATYSLMGLPFSIVRPVAALVTSLFGGALGNLTDNSTVGEFSDKDEEEATPRREDKREPEVLHKHSRGLASAASQPTVQANKQSVPEVQHITGKLLEALRYAYVEMMQDIGKWLVLGLVLAALITIFVPNDLFTVFQHNTWASMLLVLVIALPMYVCATGSIPVAVALMLKGLTPGAALVFLMAGPASNFASMLVVRKAMGWTALFTYLLSIVVGAVAFGCLIDWLQFRGIVDFMARLSDTHACCTAPSSLFQWLCTTLLCLLLLNALVVTKLLNKHNTTIMDTTANTAANTTVYRIEGMSCNHCRATAEKALLSVPGVETATVDLDTRLAHVTGTASPSALAAAISAVGFTLHQA